MKTYLASSNTGKVRELKEKIDRLKIEETQEPDSIALAACLSGLGTVAAAQQDSKAAEQYFRRAHVILDKLEPQKEVQKKDTP